jgi:hypothetical protein
MQDYNDSAVQDSFNVPQPNPFNKSIQWSNQKYYY